jgi:hypothetical protein
LQPDCNRCEENQGVQRLLVSVLGPGLRLRHAVRAGGGGPHGRACKKGRTAFSGGRRATAVRAEVLVGRGSNTRPATMRSLDRRSGRAACAEYLLQGLAARGGVLCCQRVGAGPGLVTDDLLDGLAPAALAAVRQVAEELTVRESMVFNDGREFTGEPQGLRTIQRGQLMLVYLTDVRDERVVIIR